MGSGSISAAISIGPWPANRESACSNAANPRREAALPCRSTGDDAELTAVVALTDESLVADSEWAGYVREVAGAAHARGPAGRFLPGGDGRGRVRPEPRAASPALGPVGTAPRRSGLLASRGNSPHEFCRMLRHRVEEQPPGQPRDGDGAPALGRYLEKVRVFISHSKHDADGAKVALRIRDWIHDNGPVDSFFDVHDIPPGLSFEDVLLHPGPYERDGCGPHRYVLFARVVPPRGHRGKAALRADGRARLRARRGSAEHGLPRQRPGRCAWSRAAADRIGAVAGRLLDEVFRTWLWRCRVGPHASESPEVLFTARPPELISLAAFPAATRDASRTIVYPEPLLGADEERLFAEIAPTTRLQTLERWMEEN